MMDEANILKRSPDVVTNALPCDIFRCRTKFGVSTSMEALSLIPLKPSTENHPFDNFRIEELIRPEQIPERTCDPLDPVSTILPTPRSDLQPQTSSIASLQLSASGNEAEADSSVHEKVARLGSLYPPNSLNDTAHSSPTDGRPEAKTSIVHASSVILDGQPVSTNSNTDTQTSFDPVSLIMINSEQQVAHAEEATTTIVTSTIANDEWLVAQPQSESLTQAGFNDATTSAPNPEKLVARLKRASLNNTTTAEANIGSKEWVGLQSRASPLPIVAVTLPVKEKTGRLGLESVGPDVRLGEYNSYTAMAIS